MRVWTILNFAPQLGQAMPTFPLRRPDLVSRLNPGSTCRSLMRANFQRTLSVRNGAFDPLKTFARSALSLNGRSRSVSR